MKRTALPTLLSPLLLAALAPAVRADLLTGTVVDQNGVGVYAVNIDVVATDGGNDPTVSNDSTGPDGSFAVTVTPAGTYRVIFKPPVPPATTHLILQVDDVTISGTTDMGTVALPAGVALYGRVIGPNAQPVAGVNLDVIDQTTGDNLPLQGDSTDGAGQFVLAVPAGPIEVRFDPAPSGQMLAPLALDLALGQDTQLGDVQLEQGFLITAIVRDTGGFPVAGADFDAIDSATGEKLYTPGDDTSSTGFVDFVVRAGTFDFEVCPPPGARLVAERIAGVSVNGNTSLGLITLEAGFVLSGRILAHTGLPVANVDVDAKDLATGVDILLCGDNSDANGDYAVILPAGTFKVTFSPPYALPLAADIHQPVVITGDTVLGGTLPLCEFYTNMGSGTPGSGGITPGLIAVGGTPRLGNPDYRLAIRNGLGGAQAFLFISLGGCPSSNGWNGPFRALQPRLVKIVLSGGSGVPGVGAGGFDLPIPADPVFAGLSIFVTAQVVDPQGPGGLSDTPALCALICN